MKHLAKSVSWVGLLTLITILVLIMGGCAANDNQSACNAWVEATSYQPENFQQYCSQEELLRALEIGCGGGKCNP